MDIKQLIIGIEIVIGVLYRPKSNVHPYLKTGYTQQSFGETENIYFASSFFSDS